MIAQCSEVAHAPLCVATDDRAQSQSDRNIPTPGGGDTWSQVTVMRAMRRLGLAGK